MQIILATVIVLALVALFAAPALAARLGGQVAQPVVVAAGEGGASQLKLDKHITFDSQLNGAIKFDLSSSRIGDKWRVTSLQCDDVTVVATNAQGAVATTKAGPAPGDPASCVYSMKVPSGELLSVYAVLGSGKSVGITGLHKLADGSYAKVATTSDLKTENFLKLDTFKGGLQTIKLANGGTETLPLYLKLDT